MTTIHSSRTLGTLIRGRRLDRGLSQSDLADLVGVSRKWIGDIERGKPTAEIGLIIRLLDSLDLDFQATSRSSSDQQELEAPPEIPRVDLDKLLKPYQS